MLETDPEIQQENIAEQINATKTLISSSLHLGLDLKDDLSRFQVIKVPYPSLGNPWIDEKRKVQNLHQPPLLLHRVLWESEVEHMSRSTDIPNTIIQSIVRMVHHIPLSSPFLNKYTKFYNALSNNRSGAIFIRNRLLEVFILI